VSACSVAVVSQVTVVVKRNYTDVSDAGTASSSAENETHWTRSSADSEMHQFVYYTVMDRDSRLLLEFNQWIHSFLFKLVPCILLTALTVMLIVVMHQANVRRMKLKSQVNVHSFFYFSTDSPSPSIYSNSVHLVPAT